MWRLWRSLNRGLIPRRYWSIAIGVLFGTGAAFETVVLIRHPAAGRGNSWVWVGLLGIFSIIRLTDGIRGFLAWRSGRRYNRSRLLRRCLQCGYDLRANVSGRCPECGREH